MRLAREPWERPGGDDVPYGAECGDCIRCEEPPGPPARWWWCRAFDDWRLPDDTASPQECGRYERAWWA